MCLVEHKMASYAHRIHGFLSSMDNTMDHEEKRSCFVYHRDVNLQCLDSRQYGLSLEQFLIYCRMKKTTCQSPPTKLNENICCANLVAQYRKMVMDLDVVSHSIRLHQSLRSWYGKKHQINLVMLIRAALTTEINFVQVENHSVVSDRMAIHSEYSDSKNFRTVFSETKKIDSVFSQWKYSSWHKKFHSVFSELKTLDSVLSQCQYTKRISENLIGEILNGCSGGTVYVNRYLVIYQHAKEIQSEASDPYIQFGGRRKASTCDDIVWLVESISDVKWIVMRDFQTVGISMGNHFLNDEIQAISAVNELEVGNKSGRDFISSFPLWLLIVLAMTMCFVLQVLSRWK